MVCSFGGLDQVPEQCHDLRNDDIEAFLRDVEYRLRKLSRNPGYTAHTTRHQWVDACREGKNFFLLDKGWPFRHYTF